MLSYTYFSFLDFYILYKCIQETYTTSDSWSQTQAPGGTEILDAPPPYIFEILDNQEAEEV